jgi:hypothetical protein
MMSMRVVVVPEKNTMLVRMRSIHRFPTLRPMSVSLRGERAAMMIPTQGMNEAIIRTLSSSVYTQSVRVLVGVAIDLHDDSPALIP